MANFCKFCGAPLTDGQPCSCEQAQKAAQSQPNPPAPEETPVPPMPDTSAPSNPDTPDMGETPFGFPHTFPLGPRCTECGTFLKTVCPFTRQSH